MNRYYIQFVKYNVYRIIDRFNHIELYRGSLDYINTIADELSDVDDYIH